MAEESVSESLRAKERLARRQIVERKEWRRTDYRFRASSSRSFSGRVMGWGSGQENRDDVPEEK